MKEIVQAGNIIIFIDELHTLVGAGAAEGSIDASNMLKPALSRGEIQCIGATTLDEYRKHIEKDGALKRRFQPIHVQPPSIDETVRIIQGFGIDTKNTMASKLPKMRFSKRSSCPIDTSPTGFCRTRRSI